MLTRKEFMAASTAFAVSPMLSAGGARNEVAAACLRHCDAVSYNIYGETIANLGGYLACE